MAASDPAALLFGAVSGALLYYMHKRKDVPAAAAAKPLLGRQPPAMVIADEAGVEAKVGALIAGGLGNLKLVMDFDRTMSTFWSGSGVPGKKGQTCHGLAENACNESQKAQARALNDYYYPIEVDPALTREQKIPLMQEWYAGINDVIVQTGMTRGDLTRAVAAGDVTLRPGVTAILDFVAATGVPLVIFSAGIGDVLVEVIRQKYGALPPQVMVISNMMVWSGPGDDAVLTGFEGTTRHMFNKTMGDAMEHEVEKERERGAGGAAGAAAVAVSENPLRQTVLARRNAILIGDGLGDATMCDGVDHAVVLKVGLCNDNVEALLPKYTAAFDIVLTNDAPLTMPVDLLGRVAAASSTAAVADAGTGGASTSPAAGDTPVASPSAMSIDSPAPSSPAAASAEAIGIAQSPMELSTGMTPVPVASPPAAAAVLVGSSA